MSMATPVDVLTFGEAMMSLRSHGPLRLGRDLTPSVAGAESNAAICLARLGHHVRWVGVLGGEDKLSPVTPREIRSMKVFGYNMPESEQPFLRLACQAKANGNATIVIPPWNAVFGKKVYGNVEDLELYPATTSAKVLRETIATAVKGE